MVVFGCMTVGLLVGGALLGIIGRKEGGGWRYCGIRWFEHQIEKKGFFLPEWIEEKGIFRTWLLLVCGCFFLFAGSVSVANENQEITKLPRPVYGTGSVQEDLEVQWKNEKGVKEKRPISIEVEEQKLSKKEEDQVLFEVRERLGKEILGENKRSDAIYYPLQLVEKIEGLPVDITWMSSNPEVVDWEGKLGENISKEGEIVCLTACLQIGMREENYIQYVRVYPPKYSMEEQVQYLVKKHQKENETENWIELPEEIGNIVLSWKRENKNQLQGAILCFMFVPFLLLFRDKQKLEEEKKKEREQLMQDYPEIVSKMVLLLGAGVNMRTTMERLGSDYKKYKKKGGERKAYEIILQICEEMGRGISEKEAYENFGERCELLSYRTLSSLMVQHLQKGSRDMGRMLEEEASKAQELRLQRARILGEQASTKLLLPMMMMLVIVFVILLIPAWLHFAM